MKNRESNIVVEDTIKYENTSTNTAKEGKVSEVFNDGTMGFGSVANVELPARMLAAQSVFVDGISGASASTAAIRTGVTRCLEEAGAGEEFFRVPDPEPHTEEEIHTEVLVVGSGIVIWPRLHFAVIAGVINCSLISSSVICFLSIIDLVLLPLQIEDRFLCFDHSTQFFFCWQIQFVL